MQLDLPPKFIIALTGRPAPELRRVKGWDNGGPTTLADLRGKVVLLDFWGHWCGPCLAAMPELMALHDEFAGRGLEIIAVHDDSVASVAEMNAKLAGVPDDPDLGWGGRRLPFRVALDGGGETRIAGTANLTSGATTAAYGVQRWPTTVLIGRDGDVIGEVDVGDPEGRAKVEAALAR